MVVSLVSVLSAGAGTVLGATFTAGRIDAEVVRKKDFTALANRVSVVEGINRRTMTLVRLLLEQQRSIATKVGAPIIDVPAELFIDLVDDGAPPAPSEPSKP